MKLDLLKVSCPIGTKIIIDGEGETVVTVPKPNIFLAIAYARAIITKKGVVADKSFLKRIVVLERNEEQKLIKVRIEPEKPKEAKIQGTFF